MALRMRRGGRARRDDLQVVGGHAAQLRALARVDGGDRGAVAAAAARFHLDEDDDVAVARDRVDLAAGQADVARDDAVAEPRELRDRRILARGAERGHDATISSANGSARAMRL
jgi:hypothetical protein